MELIAVILIIKSQSPVIFLYTKILFLIERHKTVIHLNEAEKAVYWYIRFDVNQKSGASRAA
jgi:hypothetical protein